MRKICIYVLKFRFGLFENYEFVLAKLTATNKSRSTFTSQRSAAVNLSSLFGVED